MSVKKDEVQVTVVVDGKQGISELGKLEMEANDLRHTMQGLKKDSQEYTQAAAQYQQVKASMAELREQIGLAGLTMKQMRAYARELQTELDTTATRGTERFDELKGKLQEVNGAIAKQRAEVAGTSSFWSKISTEIKQFGMLAVGALGFQFVTDQITNLIAKGSKLSDELSDVQKTTGMTAAEVRQLNSDLSKLDTRTPTSELRKIAAGAGALGIAKEDVLAFTAATDKLVVSLGDEFEGGAEEITKVMGGLRNIFADVKSANISEDMLHIGNAINQLGAAGAATGPVVADLANRIGGVGITMGLTSGQVLGLSATLQELNVSTERGGTATVKILQAMAAEPAKFAKVAGLSTKEFTNLVNNDLYGALVKVTEGAAKSGNQATALAKVLSTLGVDGAGASEVMAKLGTNTELLDQKVKLASTSLGQTNSIMSEFATKNDNLAGKIEKLTKYLSGAFTNSKFNDALESMVSGLTKLLGLTDEVKELTASWERQRDAVAGLHQNVEPLLARYDQLKASTSTTAEEQQELKKVIEEIGEALPQAVTQFDNYGVAMEISRDKTRQLIQEQEAMLQYVNKDAIKKQLDELEKLHQKHTQLKAQMELGGKAVSTQVEYGDGKFRKETDWQTYSQEELNKMRAELKQLMKDITGAEANVAKLSGKQTQAEQQAAEAAKNGLKKLKDVSDTQLGILEDLDTQIKALREKQLHEATEAGIRADEAEIKRLEKKRTDLLGTTKATHDKLREQALKGLHDLQALAMGEEAKLRDVDADKNQQAINQLQSHYDKLIQKALEFSKNSKLTEQERRDALATIDLLADEREEATANLKKQQAEKRAAEDLKFENEHALARANLRILLAKREEKTNPEEYKNALIAKIELERDIELQNTKLTEDQRQLIIKESEDKIQGIKISSLDKQKAQEKKVQDEIRKYQQQMLNTLVTMFNRADSQELNALTKKKDRKLALLEQQKTQGLITAEQYEAQKSGIETEYENKSATLKKDQFQKQQAADVIKAIIDGIMAAQAALAEIAINPAAAALLPWIEATTAMNVAAIIAQPVPEFRDGGFTANGFTGLDYQNLSQSAGGMLPGGPFLATVNEVGPEYFVPHHLLQQPAVARSVEIIEAIRTGQPGFIQGGYTASAAPAALASPGPSSAGALDQATALRLAVATEQLVAQLANPLPVRAYMVYKDVTDAGQQLTTLQQDASF
ncbi:MAG: phage tail tape measure protein [Janthinobacterium lividum]